MTNKSIHCSDCGETFTWSRHYMGWGRTAQGAYDHHKPECERETRLQKDILLCQKQTTEIYKCLNCQHYGRKCSWTNNR